MVWYSMVWYGRNKKTEREVGGKERVFWENYANGVPHMGVLIGRGLSQEGEEEAEVRGEGSTRMAG